MVGAAIPNQAAAIQAVALVSFLLSFLLSGFIFPISSMPPALQAITYIVPARYFLIALRGVVLKGSGLHAIGPSLGALTIYASVVLVLASIRLRKEWA